MIRRFCQRVLIIVCLLFAGQVYGSQSPRRTARSRLKADLRARREAVGPVSPAEDSINLVDLSICFWPFAIIQVDEVKQTVSTLTSIILVWTDPDLVWNASDYNNISYLTEELNSLWKPTITFPNSADNDNLVLKSVTDKVMVLSNGTVKYFTSVFLNTYCELDLTSYPFDEQKCHILMLPFVDDSLYRVYATSMTMQPPYRFNGEWSIQGRQLTTESYVDFTGYNLTMAKVTLNLKRRSTYYVFSIVIPLLLMSFMTPIVFWIPPTSGERVSYLVSIFLSMTVYLSYAIGTLPRSINQMPKLLIFLIAIMGQTFISIIGTAIVMKKHAVETASAQNTRRRLASGRERVEGDTAHAGGVSAEKKKNRVAPECQSTSSREEEEDQTTKDDFANEVLKESDVTSGLVATRDGFSISSRQWDMTFFIMFYVTCVPLYIFIIFF